VTNFAPVARQVRDHALDPVLRRRALKDRVHHFAPYGFQATWHHLFTTHHFPAMIQHPARAGVRVGSLVGALDELEEARALSLLAAAAFAVRRRAEKAAGNRRPGTPDPWNSWGHHRLAHCPDPRHHPTEPLPVVCSPAWSLALLEQRPRRSARTCKIRWEKARINSN
jgi:hypothetical protein